MSSPVAAGTRAVISGCERTSWRRQGRRPPDHPGPRVATNGTIDASMPGFPR
ncbi:MAG TPA: hypothetical protein VED63_13065 [Acidimicrobiales bacterium]|nr:hypothetical protein [Acidimicrobiales bacterium]